MRDIFCEEEVGGDEMPPSAIPAVNNCLDYPYLKFRDNGEWREQAKCLGKHELLSIFFPETGRGNRRKPIVAKAKAICADCPVKVQCFTFAKNNKFDYGVWGGVDFFKPSRMELREYIPDSVD